MSDHKDMRVDVSIPEHTAALRTQTSLGIAPISRRQMLRSALTGTTGLLICHLSPAPIFAMTAVMKCIMISSTVPSLNPVSDSWKLHLEYLGKTRPSEVLYPLEEYLNSNGFQFALFALSSVKGHDGASRLFACYCAKYSLVFFERKYPDDKRPRQAIETAERFARGQVTIEDLIAAGHAAQDAAFAARRDAAIAFAARSAVWDAARDRAAKRRSIRRAWKDAHRAAEYTAACAAASTADVCCFPRLVVDDALWAISSAAKDTALTAWRARNDADAASDAARDNFINEFRVMCRLEREYGSVDG